MSNKKFKETSCSRWLIEPIHFVSLVLSKNTTKKKGNIKKIIARLKSQGGEVPKQNERQGNYGKEKANGNKILDNTANMNPCEKEFSQRMETQNSAYKFPSNYWVSQTVHCAG